MRPLWFVAGAGAGLYVAFKARRAAEALTPEGLSDRVAGLQVGWHLFADEVRAGMGEKEDELRERMAVLAAPHEERRALPAAKDTDDATRVATETDDLEGPPDGQQ